MRGELNESDFRSDDVPRSDRKVVGIDRCIGTILVNRMYNELFSLLNMLNRKLAAGTLFS